MTAPQRQRRAAPATGEPGWVAPGPLALAIGTLLVLSYCGELRPDEFECEHAIAHLLDCCADLVVDSDDCLYRHNSCSGDSLYPILSEQEALCVQELPCAEIQTRDICEAVQTRSHGEEPAYGAPALCP